MTTSIRHLTRLGLYQRKKNIKICAESFHRADHLHRIQEEERAVVNAAMASRT